MKKNNKKKKVNIKKLFKGFTLVELLAVIVILAIIMIIAIPSVLNTMETARQKTFIEYYQKAVNAAEKKYIEDSNFGTLPAKGNIETFYVYYIKEDLGFSSTGEYDGFVAVRAKDNKTTFATMLYTNNYYLYTDTMFYDEPTNEDIIDTNKINDIIKEMTGGTYTNIKDMTIDSLIKMVTELFYQCAEGDVPYYRAKTGDTIATVKYISDNWHDGECTEYSLLDLSERLK